MLVVGSGTHFISGVSHYTRYVALALAERTPVSVILMRRLIPRALYPGRARVGDETLTDEDYPPEMEVFDGVDWYWIPSMLGALRLLRRSRPEACCFNGGRAPCSTPMCCWRSPHVCKEHGSSSRSTRSRTPERRNWRRCAPTYSASGVG